jgi:hypothetical protein
VHATRNEQKAAWYSRQHGSNEVIIKLKVALGRYVEINGQAHPLQKTWMEHGCGSAFAPAGGIGVREENCIAGRGDDKAANAHANKEVQEKKEPI